MKATKKTRVFSGASPTQVRKDLQPLVDFQEEGLSLPALRQMLEKKLFPHLMNYDLTQFQSMFNTKPEEGAKFGAVIALRYNQGVTNWQVSPGGAVLEELCGRALCQLFGFSLEAEATFMYCGTYANQQALYMALHQKAEEEGFDLAEKGLQGFRNSGQVVVLTSEDAHFSLRHAMRMLGLGEKNLISLPVDKNRKIIVQKLQDKLQELKGKKVIACVVATAGTTSTGAVDPILPIAEICQKAGIWLHLDGAYGLAYCLVPEWEHFFSGREMADSVSWDPHKQLGIPIPNSVLFVRRRENFKRMFLFNHYFNPQGDDKPNPGLKSPPSTRPFSTLPLITSLRHQGMRKVIERLRAPLVAVKNASFRIMQEDEMELCLKPETGILCFRIIPKGFPEEKLDKLQEYIYETIMKEGIRTISKTKLGSKTVLRLVAVSPHLTEEHLMETAVYCLTIAKKSFSS